MCIPAAASSTRATYSAPRLAQRLHQAPVTHESEEGDQVYKDAGTGREPVHDDHRIEEQLDVVIPHSEGKLTTRAKRIEAHPLRHRDQSCHDQRYPTDNAPFATTLAESGRAHQNQHCTGEGDDLRTDGEECDMFHYSPPPTLARSCSKPNSGTL